MSKTSIFSILYKSHYAEISTETIARISKLLLARTEKTTLNLCELIENINELIKTLELNSCGEVDSKDRAHFITLVCILVKFFSPLMEQLDTIIDREVIIHKRKENYGQTD